MVMFDVMLPYYGDVSLMQAAVRSVMAQSYPHWRLTVVDDGQEPGVPEWFAQIDDDRVHYQRNDHNLGVSGNYRQCIGLVESNYMIMMGTDDIMLPDYLAVIRRILDQFPGVAMIQPGVEIIDSQGTVTDTLVDQVKRKVYAPRTSSTIVMGGQDLATSLLRGNWFYFPSLCWRTDAIRDVGFREDLTVIQDLALVIELIERGEKMAIDPTVCFRYRRHAMSVSSAGAIAGTRFTEAQRYFLEISDRMRARGWTRAERAARWHLSSRLHACTLLPTALWARNMAGVRNLSQHAFNVRRER